MKYQDETRAQRMTRLWHLHSDTIKEVALAGIVIIIGVMILSTLRDGVSAAGNWITQSAWWLGLRPSIRHILSGLVPGTLGIFWLRSEFRALKYDGWTFYRVSMVLGSIVLTGWGIYQITLAGIS